MSKIKLLVEIDEEDYGDFCDWFENIPSSVDGLPCIKGKFNQALYDAKPYDDSGDLISREALKAAITSYAREFAPDWVLNLIDNAPTVQAFTLEDMQNNYDAGQDSVVGKYDKAKGEWIKDEERSIVFDRFKCSLCGGRGYIHLRFCPNCGADMKGCAE